jgi:uncharacterized membrane-anchored protein
MGKKKEIEETQNQIIENINAEVKARDVEIGNLKKYVHQLERETNTTGRHTEKENDILRMVIACS